MFKFSFIHIADVCLGAIEVVRYMIPISGKEMTRIILNAISPLFVAIDRAKRSCLCDLVDTLAVVDPSVRILVMLVPCFSFTLLLLFMELYFSASYLLLFFLLIGCRLNWYMS